jgi:Yip1 domain
MSLTTTAGAPVRARRWLGRPLGRMFLLLWAPGDLFKSLRRRPEWLTPFLAVSLMSLLLAWGGAPYALRAAESVLPPGTPAEQSELLRRQIILGQKLNLALTPLLLLVKSLVAALVLTLLTVVVSGRGDYRRAFSALSHLNLIPLLSSAFALLVLRLRGLERIGSPLDLEVPLGLNLLIGTRHATLEAVLNVVNFFELWYLGLLVLAVRALTGCSRVEAALIGGTYWGLSVALQVTVTLLGRDALTAG